MAFQKPLPEWKQPGIRPPESKIKEGYQVLDKPPAAWLNWQMNTTYEALQELHEKAAEKEDVSQALGEAKAYTDEKVADIDLTKISPGSIGAAKQADLDAHAADAVKHITVAERAAWNQAENNAKSYIDAKPWQRHKVSGDDGAAIDITNRDLNSIVHTGFYRGTNLGNAPALLHGWGYVEVITHAPGSWVLQKVYDLHADRFYMRRLTDSGWTAWTQDLFQSGVDAKTRIAGAINAKGVPASANETFEQLAQKIGQLRQSVAGKLTVKERYAGHSEWPPIGRPFYVDIATLPAGIGFAYMFPLHTIAVKLEGWSGHVRSWLGISDSLGNIQELYQNGYEIRGLTVDLIHRRIMVFTSGGGFNYTHIASNINTNGQLKICGGVRREQNGFYGVIDINSDIFYG